MILMLNQKSYLFLRLVTLRDEVSSYSDHQGGLLLSDDVEQCFIALEQSFLFLQCLCSCIMFLSSLCAFGRVVVLEFQRFHLAVHRLAGSLGKNLNGGPLGVRVEQWGVLWELGRERYIWFKGSRIVGSSLSIGSRKNIALYTEPSSAEPVPLQERIAQSEEEAPVLLLVSPLRYFVSQSHSLGPTFFRSPILGQQLLPCTLVCNGRTNSLAKVQSQLTLLSSSHFLRAPCPYITPD